jgi:hypothetical protein
MGITRKDFKASRKRPGYYTRDLGENGVPGGGQWAEVVRKDGYGLGAMPVPYLEQMIDDIERQNVPMGEGSLDDIFAEPVVPLEPPAEDETPEVDPGPRLDENPEVEILGVDKPEDVTADKG